MRPLPHATKRPPVPRAGVYELYWQFAAKRQAAFERRMAGLPGPWSEDAVLQRYKFCNVYRAADRVSQYMIKDVAYVEDGDYADRALRIVAFRTFSNIATWEGVKAELGRGLRVADLGSGRFEKALEEVKAKNGGLYTGAFILCANKAYGFDAKHRNHVALWGEMFGVGRLAQRLEGAGGLGEVVKILEGFPLMGPFMAYQTAVDLNYSTLLDFDEDDYTQAGPGALRGLKKAFESLGDYTPSEAILWMVERQEVEFARLGLVFNGLFGRRLHAIDCQGLFCELDKYCRVARPELASARKQMKAKFVPQAALPKLFFPPKWGLVT
jgi:hypothetical protein